jgi:hypothetical protein
MSQDNLVCVATGWMARLRFPAGVRNFSLLHSIKTDSRGPPYFLSNGHQERFPRGLSGQGLKLTTRLLLVPKSRKVELYIYSPKSPHGFMFNELNNFTFSLPFTKRGCESVDLFQLDQDNVW